MKKKLIIIIGIIVVVAAIGFTVLKKPANVHVTMKQDSVTGLSIYNNLDYGFSVAYPADYWQGPVEKFDPNADIEDPNINATFASTSTLEAVVIAGKPGDTESLNAFAAPLDSYNVVTVGGLPALRYEFVAPANEAGTLYVKAVMFVIKELKNGSVTIAYQKLAKTEKEAKAADVSKADAFVGGITFDQPAPASEAK